MTNEETLLRGQRAEQILDSAEWSDAWRLVRERLFDVIETSKEDRDALEARRMLKAAALVREELERMIADGQVAASDIAEAQRRVANQHTRISYY